MIGLPVVVIANLDNLHRLPVQHRFVIHVDSVSEGDDPTKWQVLVPLHSLGIY